MVIIGVEELGWILETTIFMLIEEKVLQLGNKFVLAMSILL